MKTPEQLAREARTKIANVPGGSPQASDAIILAAINEAVAEKDAEIKRLEIIVKAEEDYRAATVGWEPPTTESAPVTVIETILALRHQRRSHEKRHPEDIH